MIILLDLDGTLLNTNKEISQRNIDAIRDMKDKGAIIVINTVRNYIRSLPYAEIVDADFINCFSGNYIIDCTGKVLYKRCFEKSIVRNLIDVFSTIHNGWFGAECENSSYSTSYKMAEKFGIEKITLKELMQKDVMKLFFEIDESKKEIYEKVAENYGLTLVYSKSGNFCNVAYPNSNKWNGIKILKTMINSNDEDIIAFGDDNMDIKTFQNVKYPVPMGNSTKDVTDIFIPKTSSNDKDGIAEYLEKLK